MKKQKKVGSAFIFRAIVKSHLNPHSTDGTVE